MNIISYDHKDDKYLKLMPTKLLKIPDSRSYANQSRTKGEIQNLI